jgi:alanine dehydrogenase
MKIGILREEKIPEDKRVSLTPNQCKELLKLYPSIALYIQSSRLRCFTDNEYASIGIRIVDDISNCDILIGIKEVPISSLISNKTYLFFSHTIKKQVYNRNLLQEMIKKKIKMVDYEVIKSINGKRLVGFGRYAGIIGAYNGLLAYGKKTNKYSLKPAHLCEDRLEMEKELNNLVFSEEKIILTGNGRVGRGALELLEKANIRQVTKEQFVDIKFNEPVFVQLNTEDINLKSDGNAFNKKEFYNNPSVYISNFMHYAKYADIFIAGHYFKEGSPSFFTKEDMRSSYFKIKTVADISCDIDGPIPCTIRSSNINNPIYGYNPITDKEDDFIKDNVIAVMAIDNLPSELPRDASEDFGDNLISNIFPLILSKDINQIIANATICEDGILKPNFEYLNEYLYGL